MSREDIYFQFAS